MHDQKPFDIRCEWGLAGVQHIAPAEVIVVVDVLSFSTTVDIAVARGGTVFPYRWQDDAAGKYAQERNAELAGPRSVCAGAYSLSPSSLVNAPEGLRLVLPSPNGSSLAFAAMACGAQVLAGCFRNASAVARWSQRSAEPITIVPAGERWPDGSLRPAIEDLAAAGAIIVQLSGRRSPEADVAVAAFEAMKNSLLELLRQCSSGRELVERGFGADVELAPRMT